VLGQRSGISLLEAARLVDGIISDNCDPQQRISGMNTLLKAGPHEASFLANAKYRSQLKQSKAGVILVGEHENVPESLPVIRTRDPYLGFALLQRAFHPQRQASGEHHASAVIHDSAEIADCVEVGAQAVIGAGVRIGRGTIIGQGCIIGDNVNIGEDCLLHPHAFIAEGCLLGNRVILQAGAVIGSDGFGYAWNGKKHLKIPQTGRVVLEDDVEIGAKTCIDRGALGDTVIGKDVKLDNLIQIGHNVHIGAHSIMASQVGISGSTTIGAGCQIGGQAGFAGHVEIAPGCKIAAQSGVMSNLKTGVYGGSPAMPHRAWMRMTAMMQKLPDILKKLQK